LMSEPANPDVDANGFGVRIEMPVVTIVGNAGKNGSKLSGHLRFPRESFQISPQSSGPRIKPPS
ncbi:MAG: hypothetical protein Q8O06_04685, partial [Acetobacterium sp.]|nr:hypothetical protein [Acetobacterium sp.]